MIGCTYTIEPDEDGGVWLVEHGSYPDSSVLHGQDRRTLLEHFPTTEDALIAQPKADALEGSTRPMRSGDGSLADLSGLPKCPPPWFDPSYAGEHWDDDY